jgi:hypothetical protein
MRRLRAPPPSLRGVAHASARAATTSGVPAGAVNCVAKPEMTEGPYFVDEGLHRSDIRIDTSDGSMVDGTKLTLNLDVLRITDGVCRPLPAAVVDLWHCDAYGVCSDEAANDSDGDLGDQMLLSPRRRRDGWVAGFRIGLDLSDAAVGADDDPGSGPGGPPPPGAPTPSPSASEAASA